MHGYLSPLYRCHCCNIILFVVCVCIPSKPLINLQVFLSSCTVSTVGRMWWAPRRCLSTTHTHTLIAATYAYERIWDAAPLNDFIFMLTLFSAAVDKIVLFYLSSPFFVRQKQLLFNIQWYFNIDSLIHTLDVRVRRLIKIRIVLCYVYVSAIFAVLNITYRTRRRAWCDTEWNMKMKTNTRRDREWVRMDVEEIGTTASQVAYYSDTHTHTHSCIW